jgi:hypothetical protein
VPPGVVPSGPGVVAAETIRSAAPPARSARRWLAIPIVLALVAGSITIVMATRGGSHQAIIDAAGRPEPAGSMTEMSGSSHGSTAVADAAIAVSGGDAAIAASGVGAVPVDAPVDAPAHAPLVDAPHRSVDAPIRHGGTRPRPVHDAGDDLPDLPFVDAGR